MKGGPHVLTGCQVFFSATWWKHTHTHRRRTLLMGRTDCNKVLLCYQAESSYLEVWEPWQLVTSPCFLPNPAYRSELSPSVTDSQFCPPSPLPFLSSAVAIMGDICGLSILLDCQQLGQGRNFSRSPWDPIRGPGSNANCTRAIAEGEGIGLSPVVLPHAHEICQTPPIS